MKICFLTNELSPNHGWGRYSISLIDQFIKKGIDCRILASVDAQDSNLFSVKIDKLLPPLFTKRTIKIFYLLKNYWRIRKLIQESDIVHSLIEPYGLVAYLASGNKPIIITLHGTYAVDALNRWYLKKIYNRVYQKAKKIICISKFTQQVFLKKIQNNNILVINNGIDYKKFQSDQDKKRIKQDSRKIVSVGALVFRKGYHISIPAVGEVKKKYPDLKYYIVGSQKNQSYFSKLQSLAKKHNLENNIIFLEGISDQKLLELYHQTDLFLLTPVNINGSFEGFGLVYLEANACGKPVIGTYDCGAQEAIIDNFNGLLVSQNDIEETSQAILKIFDKPDLALKLGQNGRQQAQKKDWQNIVNQYIQVYKSFQQLIKRN